MLDLSITMYNSFLLIYFIMLNLLYLFLLLSSLYEIKKQDKLVSLGMHKDLSRSLVVPGVSIIVPAYNEEATISESITSLLQLDYPNFGIIIVNDGSKDGTLNVLKKDFSLRQIDKIYRKSIHTKPVKGAYISPHHPNIIVIDKENGGKADALNCGINISSHPFFCAIDSDTVLEKDAILRIMRTVQESPETIVAAGGIVRIANGCTIEKGRVLNIRVPRNPIVIFQIVEYLRSYLCGRTGFSIINGLLIISGAFGIFNKEVVKEVGGYLNDTVGEDMELVVRLHKYLREHKRPYKIVYANDPICWTEAPETLTILLRQRIRWQRGLIETMSRNISMLFNPRYGVIGLIAMPFFIFGEMLSPIIELVGLITTIIFLWFGYVDYTFLFMFLLLTFVFSIFLSWSAILLEEMSFHKYTKGRDLAKLLLFSVLETFGYRQLNSWWRLKGFIDIFRKKKDWGVMTRKGFTPSTPGEATLEKV